MLSGITCPLSVSLTVDRPNNGASEAQATTV